MALYSAPLRPRPPQPLVDRLLAQESEVEILRSFRHRSLMEEHRTGEPWCVWNQLNYLETPDREIGLTPLHVAVMMHKRKTVIGILEGGARADLVDSRGRTALMMAAQEGFPDLVELLIQAGAGLDHGDSSGRRALHYAARCQQNTSAVMEHLLVAKAIVDAMDSSGVTPLMTAASVQSKAAVAALLCHGARALQVDYVGQRAIDYSRLPQAGDVEGTASRAVIAVGTPRSTTTHTGGKKGRCAGSRYRRWDDNGLTDVEQLLFCEERRIWDRETPGLSTADRARLNCGLPRLE